MPINIHEKLDLGYENSNDEETRNRQRAMGIVGNRVPKLKEYQKIILNDPDATNCLKDIKFVLDTWLDKENRENKYKELMEALERIDEFQYR